MRSKFAPGFQQKYLLIAFALQLLWGLVPSASKLVIDEIPVELYVALRWTLSGTIFLLYLFFTGSWQKISIKDFRAVAFLGVCGYGLASLGTLYGLKTGGVVNFALIGALSPAITALIAIPVLKEKPNLQFYYALPLLTLGLIFLVLGKYQSSSLRIVGLSLMFILAGYILEAFVFIFSKKFRARMSTVQYLSIAQLSAAVLMWISQACFFHQTSHLQDLSLHGLLAGVFVSLVACVFCYLILYWLLDYIDGHTLALFDGFHSLSATIFGYFIFREALTPLMMMGGGIILCGIVIGNWPNKPSCKAIIERKVNRLTEESLSS